LILKYPVKEKIGLTEQAKQLKKKSEKHSGLAMHQRCDYAARKIRWKP
jgi:hypothetical protein